MIRWNSGPSPSLLGKSGMPTCAHSWSTLRSLATWTQKSLTDAGGRTCLHAERIRPHRQREKQWESKDKSRRPFYWNVKQLSYEIVWSSLEVRADQSPHVCPEVIPTLPLHLWLSPGHLTRLPLQHTHMHSHRRLHRRTYAHSQHTRMHTHSHTHSHVHSHRCTHTLDMVMHTCAYTHGHTHVLRDVNLNTLICTCRCTQMHLYTCAHT